MQQDTAACWQRYQTYPDGLQLPPWIGNSHGKEFALLLMIASSFGGQVSVRLVVLAMLGISASTCVHCSSPASSTQEESAASANFEVASVKPSPPSQRFINTLLNYPGGRVVAHGCTLKYLLMEAFHLQDFQITGGPRWMDKDQFDIEAVTPQSSPFRRDVYESPESTLNNEQRTMLQHLLQDRFGLRYHSVSKEAKVYVLTAKRKSPNLHAPKNAHESAWAGGLGGGSPDGEGLKGQNISISEFAERLSKWLERTVTDRTGLQGSFDFESRTGTSEAESEIDLADSIIVALKELGLSLHEVHGKVETLVVEAVTQPTPN